MIILPTLSRRKILKIAAGFSPALFLPLGVTGAKQEAGKFGLPFGGESGPATWFVRQWYGNTRWAYRQRRAIYSQGQGMHFGVDFFANCGTPVLAIGEGNVIAVDGPYGSAPNNLLVRHSNGYVSLYGHLQSRPTVKIGQPIRRGEVIAISGVPTGADCDTHPHLHLEIRTGNLAGTVNPVNLIGADWANLTLGLPGEGIDFEIDLNQPARWQNIYDQPAVTFGGPLLNDFSRPWPG